MRGGVSFSLMKRPAGQRTAKGRISGRLGIAWAAKGNGGRESGNTPDTPAEESACQMLCAAVSRGSRDDPGQQTQGQTESETSPSASAGDYITLKPPLLHGNGRARSSGRLMPSV